LTSLFSAEILIDGELSSKQARNKWEKVALKTAMQINKRSRKKANGKGRALYVHTTSTKDRKYVLYYHHNYGSDFCDTMFKGEIFDYDDGKCQILGKVTASTGIKRFSRIIMLLSIPLAILFNQLFYFVGSRVEILPFMPHGYEYNALYIFGGTILTLNAIAIMCLCIDNKKVRAISDYLNEFLKKTDADIDEELDEENQEEENG